MDGPPRPRTGVADLGARSRSPERTLQPGRLGTSQRPSKSPERPGTKTPDGWYGHFVVHVIGAKNLPNVDVLGLSDPFLKLRVKQDGGAPSKYEFKTRIIDDNLNPIWDEYFTVPVQDAAGSTYLFDVTVWDQDPNKVMFDRNSRFC